MSTAHRPSSREGELATHRNQGLLGFAVLIAATLLRPHEATAILASLGSDGPLVFGLLLAFAVVLSFNKFLLTEEIFVSPPVLAFVAMIPILGLVLSAWSAVIVSVATRAAALAQIGPIKIARSDRQLEHVKLWGLCGTYGPPMVLAALTYEALGGARPVRDASIATALRLGATLLAFQAANIAVMLRVQKALGYSWPERIKLSLVDTLIYLLGLPYAALVVWSWVALGIRGLLLTLLVGVLGTVTVRNLATARTANQRLVGRLASLANVAAAISIQCSRQELLHRIFDECSKVIDTTFFSIAILDSETGELRFELDVTDGERRPPTSLPPGEGLNAWVIQHRRPLLLGSNLEESQRSLAAVDDGVASESWLGVPMIVQDRVIGAISVQSHRKNAFSDDDVILLTAVASQAAAAVDSSNLYRDLTALNAELEERVSRRTQDLHDTNLRLVAANRAKSRFLANMSHELRTPLNSIIGFSDILRSRCRDVLPPKFLGFVENIFTTGRHLLALINDLLDLSKNEAGKLQLHIESFDIHDAVRVVANVLKGQAADSDVDVTVSVDDRLHEVALDPSRFKQILLNLLSNAIKFSPPGATVRLAVELNEESVAPLTCPSVRVRVVDAGPGIAEADLGRIFEEFYQVDGGHGQRWAGTGLGLPLTKQLVELHQGRIEVDSRPGSGTTFIVELPIAAAG